MLFVYSAVVGCDRLNVVIVALAANIAKRRMHHD